MHAHPSGYGETEFTHDGLAVGSSERAGDVLLQNLTSIEIDEVAHLAGEFACRRKEREKREWKRWKGRGSVKVKRIRKAETKGEEGRALGREGGGEG